MDFSLGEEQLMLKASAREFLEKECTKKHVREMMDDETGYSPELWRRMADLGWQGLAFPEEYGGVGSSFLDLAVLLEEMGRALVPGPFLATVTQAGKAVLIAGSEAQKQAILPGVCNGETIMTLAWLEPSGNLEADGVTVNAVRKGDSYVVNGTKLFVPDANVADRMVVVARTGKGAGEDGISLLLVDPAAAGVEINPLKTMSGEKLCEVVFKDVSVPAGDLLGEDGRGWPVLQEVIEGATVAECAWMAGGARWILETATQYAKERVQFGVPIGSFQAIQHKLADMCVEVEGATAIVYFAAWAQAERDDSRKIAASVAKAWCGDIYKRAAYQGIQIHGGIGFTWDHDMHLYFKRAKSAEVVFGDSDYHREKVAQLLDV